ncbi:MULTISPECIES: hypothetical protein [Pseudomonas]|uniref:hypothetical protein n=1 Tax=Pseudomonas TaxID=286 RepID=UPI0009900E97|nr:MULTISPECIES: hypothetical protein [Pseudomonas]AQT93786.1 hypothetical protein B1R45_11120 [Pseudomonas azotoformans]PJK33572.1 hypothetical protein CWC49_09785 [Pseudomonas sp. S09F 262]PJK43067.1 hypothetical protein CWC48_29345 [Pseudomonas sp. S10E 269]UMY51555.1 hypothetical protein MLC69_11070 [Pseudomonas azotoformans]
MEVAIDRDSVHAGDDLGSHATSIRLDPSATLRALIEVIQDAGYLPGINGGKATWIIWSSDKPIGVLAQQWPAPKLTVPPDSTVDQYFGNTEPRLLFRYWCQADPDEVFSNIKTGNEPPSRF